MKQNKRYTHYTNDADYTIERLEDEPFLGSEGKKIKMTVDIWVITKMDTGKDNDILKKVFYLSQSQRGEELEKKAA